MQEGQNSKSNHVTVTVDELKAELENYKQLYDHALDVFISVNIKSGLIESANKTVLKNLGYKLDEIAGKHIENIYPQNTG